MYHLMIKKENGGRPEIFSKISMIIILFKVEFI